MVNSKAAICLDRFAQRIKTSNYVQHCAGSNWTSFLFVFS
jgi:hypothetical protein